MEEYTELRHRALRLYGVTSTTLQIITIYQDGVPNTNSADWNLLALTDVGPEDEKVDDEHYQPLSNTSVRELGN